MHFQCVRQSVTSAKRVVPRAKSVRLQHKNAFIFILEGGLKNWKRTENREKTFSKTSFQLRMQLKKGQKQGRDERTKKKLPDCPVVFLRSFISVLLLSFFQLHP